jgi:hypothetical protein
MDFNERLMRMRCPFGRLNHYVAFENLEFTELAEALQKISDAAGTLARSLESARTTYPRLPIWARG